jgi:sulfide:quinone oxidoreductase
MAGFRVVICGGGIAGVEGLLRLRRLAGDQVEVTLIAPEEELVVRPLTVLEPFTGKVAPRYPITRIAADTGAQWLRDSLAWVDRAERVVHTSGGGQVPYDALLLALGGGQRPASPGLDVFTGHDGGALYAGVVESIEAGAIAQLVFLLPPGPVWPLPLYELALLTAKRARGSGRAPELRFVIPGPQPLAPFGGDAGEVMTELLAAAGITLYTNATARLTAPHTLVLDPTGTLLHPDRTITVPTISGPNIRGIPGFAADRFLHVDEYCRVRDTDGRVFAAGDATDLPVKHGGIGAQQADTAAAGISHLAGVGPAPERLRPRINATLLTGADPLYLSAYLIDGRGWHATFYEAPPWPEGEKVIAEELAPYLRGLDSTP